MCWDVFENSLRRSGEDERVLGPVVIFLQSGYGDDAAETLNPRTIARMSGVGLPDVVALLEHAVQLEVVRRRYWLTCPNRNAGVRWVEDEADLPDQFPCDIDECGEEAHELEPGQIEIRYAVSERC